MQKFSALRGAFPLGASLAALTTAQAQDASAGGTTPQAQAAVPGGLVPESNEEIVANHTVTPGPGNPATAANFANSPLVLDRNGQINGIGQQIAFIQTSATLAGLSPCSGSLINPRTVITASHCVHSRAVHLYGSQTGTGGGVNGNFGTGRALITSQGVPLSFGSTNRCQGVAVNGCAIGQSAYEEWRDSGFPTNIAAAIYNANQVFYLTPMQPVALGGGGEFAHGDIALVTLDTHVQDIPTWTLLFSPLEGPTHAKITGYGGNGVGLAPIGSLGGINYRRRSAENMINGLFTNKDWVARPAINPGNTTFASHQHSIYWLDFDDPNFDVEAPPTNFFMPNVLSACLPNTGPTFANNYCGRDEGYYDFNGLGGVTLPNEGATAGGRFERPADRR